MKTETVEEFLKRGGKIKKIVPPPREVKMGTPVGASQQLLQRGTASSITRAKGAKCE